MKYSPAFGLVALLLAGGAAVAAVSADLPGEQPSQGLSIPATPTPINLACSAAYESTMGDTTAGIEQDQTEPAIRSSAFVVGGGEATMNGDVLAGQPRVWRGDNPRALIVDAGDTPGIAAGLTERIQERGELAGFALTPCVPPAASHVLVGGSTGLSSSAQLVLTSTSTSAAQVTIEVLTSSGRAPATPISSIAVGGGATEKVLIEAGVLDERIAVRVSASGGRVAAHLLTHSVEGLVGTGSATVVPGSEQGTTQVIPAVDFGQEPTLRLVSTSEEPAVVTAHIASDMSEVPGLTDVTVAPGSVLDLSMSGLGEEVDGLVITSDQSISAAVMTASDNDRAWMASAVETTRAASVIPAGRATLHAFAPGGADVMATFYDGEGDVVSESNVSVTSTVIDIPEGAAFVTLESDQLFYAGILAVRFTQEMSGIEALPMTIPPAGSNELAATIRN